MIGTKLGPYEITAKLGEGGMGEVYRATDTRLKREVAIKVLPAALTANQERLKRFEREAQFLAQLNHPNIAQVYGLEANGETRALVMELVEGPTLGERLEQGRLPPGECLAIALQIAEALEEAHEKGIVHRDLKPQNIKSSIEGKVKVLDFGLAKAMDNGGSFPSPKDLAHALTASFGGTRDGVILGTAAYMAPEQARGGALDKRADIWAFGVVLFEMLSGARLFAGESIVDTLGAVMEKKIDFSRLPPSTPTNVRELVRRCLERNPKNRLRDIGDARIALDGADIFGSSDPPAPMATLAPHPSSSNRRRILSAAAIGATASLVTGVLVWQARSPPPSAIVRFAITLDSFQVRTRMASTSVAVSPDGNRIAYVADQKIVLKQLSDVEGRPIAGSAETQAIMGLVFSPDGEEIAYYSWSEQAIRRVPVAGGQAVTVCKAEAHYGLSWSGDWILFGQPSALMRVAASGGTPEVLVRASAGERLYGPQLLPGGKSILFTAASDEPWDESGKVVAQVLDSGERKLILDGGAADARFLPKGQILFVRGGVVYASSFDVATLEARGLPVRLIEGVRRSEDGRAMDLSVSATGTLVYAPGPVSGAKLNLALFDQKGGIEPLAISAGVYSQPRVSPDGGRVALVKAVSGDSAIWIADLSGATAERRLTFDGHDRSPVWSPDGERITFQSERGIFWQRADGSGAAERVTRADPEAVHTPQSWSPDGQSLLFDETRSGNVSLWLYSAQEKTSRVLVNGGSLVPSEAQFSPDGRWIAYTVEEAVQDLARIYVQPFPPTGAKYLVSSPEEDAHHSAWSRDGRELFYTPGPGNRLVRMTITTSSSFQVSPSVTLRRRFTNAPPRDSRTFDVTPDGRFLGLIESGVVTDSGAPRSQFFVVLNWFEETRAKVRAR